MKVALTFDAEHPDHPFDPQAVKTILALLAEANVRATFFLQGRWVTANPGCAQEIAGLGHLIGNHSHCHTPLPWLTDAGIYADLRDSTNAIREHTRTSPRFYRAPFGLIDARTAEILQRVGTKVVGWTVDSEDYKTEDWEQVARNIEAGMSDNVAIVLMHTWPASTPKALERVLATSHKYVTVDEL